MQHGYHVSVHVGDSLWGCEQVVQSRLAPFNVITNTIIIIIIMITIIVIITAIIFIIIIDQLPQEVYSFIDNLLLCSPAMSLGFAILGVCLFVCWLVA